VPAHNVLLGVTVGKVFNKPTITRTGVGDEPMVTLDAAALTARIGAISHPVKPVEPVYRAIAGRPQETQPRWRSYLRARSS
jgi:hypothetical protein